MVLNRLTVIRFIFILLSVDWWFEGQEKEVKQRSISLPEKYWNEIQEIADELKMSVSHVIRDIVAEWRKGKASGGSAN